MEERELASHAISHHLEPVCPRDDHQMKLDSDGVRWEQTADNATFKSCNVSLRLQWVFSPLRAGARLLYRCKSS